jgi:hypothetical protein
LLVEAQQADWIQRLRASPTTPSWRRGTPWAWAGPPGDRSARSMTHYPFAINFSHRCPRERSREYQRLHSPRSTQEVPKKSFERLSPRYSSRCEHMPHMMPPPPRPSGPLTGPAVGNAPAPTYAYPSSNAASHVAAPRTPHRAHTQVRSQPQPFTFTRTHRSGLSRSLPSIGLQVQLYSCAATQLQTLSPSAPRRERHVARQHHGASGRSSGGRRLSLATLTSM